MKRLASPIIALFLFVSVFCLRPAYTEQPRPDEEFAQWQELKEGQGGYCLTVLRGTKIEKIDVKYIATAAHPLSEKEKTILIELTSHVPKGAAAVMGTSGSPVYFNVRGKWRLAGAIAFKLHNFPKNGTLMGVTPIKAMIADKNSASPRSALPLFLHDTRFGQLKIEWLPVRLSNFSAGENPEEKREFRKPEPGDSVTMMFSEGASNIGALCTVTYVRDNRFWACGHQIVDNPAAFGENPLFLPSYRTKMAITLFSGEFSYKLAAENLEYFGTIVRDTPFAAEGLIGESNSAGGLLPVSVKISGTEKNSDHRFRVTINKWNTQGVLGAGIGNILINEWPNKESTAFVKTEVVISFKDRPDFRFYSSTVSRVQEERFGPFVNTSNAVFKSIDRVAETISEICNSEWGFEVENASVDFTVIEAKKMLFLDSVMAVDEMGLEVDKVRAGDKIHLLFAFRNFDNEKILAIRLPLEIPNLNPVETQIAVNFLPLIIAVRDGSARNSFERPLAHRPDSKEDFLARLAAKTSGDPTRLYINVILPPEEVGAEEKMPVPPVGADWTQLTVDQLKALRAARVPDNRILTTTLEAPDPSYVFEADYRLILKFQPR